MAKINWKSKEQIELEQQQREQERLAKQEHEQKLNQAPSRIQELENENLDLWDLLLFGSDE